MLLDEDARRTQRRARTVVIGTAVAGVVVLMLIAAFVFNTTGDGKVRAGGTSPPTLSDVRGPGGTGPRVPTATLNASTVKWVDYHGAKLPTSSAGPHHADAWRASGWDHSPDGAVLAGVHLLMRTSGDVGPKVFEPTINNQMVGTDKDLYLSKVETEYQRLKTLEPVGANGELTQSFIRGRQDRAGVWGYQVTAYTGDTAFVDLMLRTFKTGSAGPTFVKVSVNMKWVQGDWRLSAPPQGEWMNVSQLVPEPTGEFTSLVGA